MKATITSFAGPPRGPTDVGIPWPEPLHVTLTACRRCTLRAYGARRCGVYMSLALDQREALNLLARSAHGHRKSILLAHGLPTETLRSLLRDGLIIAEREPAFLSGGKAIVVTRVRITDAGRRALG